MKVAEILEELDISAENTLMVGDSQTDMQAALNAGVARFLLTYGYGDPNLITVEPDYKTNDFSDLLMVVN